MTGGLRGGRDAAPQRLYTSRVGHGCIGVACGESGRYSMFAASIAQLERPAGTTVHFSVGSDREPSRNLLARRALDEGADWLLFLDDDHVFGPDLLMRLLAHQVDLVGALYLRRGRPFTPIAYRERLPDGRWVPIELSGRSPRLVEVAAVGTGGMLVRRAALEAIAEPWFERRPEGTEDLLFCERALAAGTQPHVDVSTPMGHMTAAAVWPSPDELGPWRVSFDLASGEATFVTEAAR